MSKQTTYKKLVPWYDKAMNNGIGCHEIADQTPFSYDTVLRHYSTYLRERFEEKEKERELERAEADKENICPTCGRHKATVCDEAICRDIIHFV